MLPNAPTDNLYKFVTFIGMALFVFCTWQLSETAKSVETQLFDAKLQEKILTLRVKESQEAVARIEQDADTPTSDAEEKERQNLLLKSRLDQIRQELTSMLSQSEKNLLGEGRARLQEIQFVEDDKAVLQIGQWGGLAAAIAGIILWYLLHQRHQDGLLRSQRRSVEPKTEVTLGDTRTATED